MNDRPQDDRPRPSHRPIAEERVETGPTGEADKGGLPIKIDGASDRDDPNLEARLEEAVEQERRRREAQQLGSPHAARSDAARPHAARPDAARPDAARPHAARPHAARPDANAD